MAKVSRKKHKIAWQYLVVALAVAGLLVAAGVIWMVPPNTFDTVMLSGSDNTHFADPSSVAVNNATGHVYVADTRNCRVQVFDSAGNYQYTIGVAKEYGHDNAHFSYPVGVAV
ncbi:MAG: NHL repeat-containing protein, partial [Promethearchaeota archaeon CR_4]